LRSAGGGAECEDFFTTGDFFGFGDFLALGEFDGVGDVVVGARDGDGELLGTKSLVGAVATATDAEE
jgi:hypothetical protein